MTCKCGSKTHEKTSHMECPLNKPCKCGSKTHRIISHSQCPMNRVVLQAAKKHQPIKKFLTDPDGQLLRARPPPPPPTAAAADAATFSSAFGRGINQVDVDNKRAKAQNSNNTSGYRGVSWYKDKSKWGANIWVDSKLLFLGWHENIEIAAARRAKAEAVFDYRPLDGEDGTLRGDPSLVPDFDPLDPLSGKPDHHLKEKHKKWLVRFNTRGAEFRTCAVADNTTARQVRDRLFAELEIQFSYNLQIRKLNEDVLHSMWKKGILRKDRTQNDEETDEDTDTDTSSGDGGIDRGRNDDQPPDGGAGGIDE
ncbi:hypothetical protein HDU88_003586 [Geranomyces variabilis]|nr:hypothetical protein HDU88_003586 [Geranomyces variabilis]